MKKIIKSSGQKQRFSESKFERSLRRAGADVRIAREIASEVLSEDHWSTTEELHRKTLRKLTKKYRPLAARYNLKRAIMQMGPSGYPFEKFVAAIFVAEGYKVKLNQMIAGRCVSHEVDVLAHNDERKVFIECKYHTRPGMRSDIKVPLYVKARFDDVYETLSRDAGGRKIQGLVVTNTQFSGDARRYAECVAGLGLIGWSRPRGFSLAELIDRTGLHPVSALTTLTRKQKDNLMKQGIVLCRDIVRKPRVLQGIGLSHKKAVRVINEAAAVRELRNTME